MTVAQPARESLSLNNDQIRELIPHRWPMLLLDRVKGVAIKNVAGTEIWFQGHFPDEAILPGVVVIEAMAQLAGVVFSLTGTSKISYLAGVRSMRFRRRIVPGDQLVLTAERSAGEPNEGQRHLATAGSIGRIGWRD